MEPMYNDGWTVRWVAEMVDGLTVTPRWHSRWPPVPDALARVGRRDCLECGLDAGSKLLSLRIRGALDHDVARALTDTVATACGIPHRDLDERAEHDASRLAHDAAGGVHVSYYDGTVDGNLKYAYRPRCEP